MTQMPAAKFRVKLNHYSKGRRSDLLLDFIVQYESDPKKFWITFTAIITPVFEGGFCIKDCSLYHPQNVVVIANTLLPEEHMAEFKRHNIGQCGEWRRTDDLTSLLNQLDECICRILENIEVKYHIDPECLSNGGS